MDESHNARPGQVRQVVGFTTLKSAGESLSRRPSSKRVRAAAA
jgi:hypothetical protein